MQFCLLFWNVIDFWLQCLWLQEEFMKNPMMYIKKIA